MKLFAAALVGSLTLAGPAGAVDRHPWLDSVEAELAHVAAMIAEADDWVYVTSDPLRRAIVCRIGDHAFSLRALSRALGVSSRRIFVTVQELMTRRLVRLTEDGLVTPFDEPTRDILRRWAWEWCSGDDQCASRSG